MAKRIAEDERMIGWSQTAELTELARMVRLMSAILKARGGAAPKRAPKKAKEATPNV